MALAAGSVVVGLILRLRVFRKLTQSFLGLSAGGVPKAWRLPGYCLLVLWIS